MTVLFTIETVLFLPHIPLIPNPRGLLAPLSPRQQQILPLLKEYKVIVLGDGVAAALWHREFCSVDLGNWLKTRGVSFCLRLKKNQYLEIENLLWQRLDSLGIVPGTSLYFQGVRVRKTKPVTGFDVACKWKRNYQGFQVKDAWFILTDLGSLSGAIVAYSQRMGIEEMFRDCKKGGYDIEGTGLRGERLIKVILLMVLADSIAIFMCTRTFKKSRYKNMFLVRKIRKENTGDGVHLALA